jgi:uncharacterized protein YbjT (DUF2867 family)
MSPTANPILVLGATGTHGGAVARGLLAGGNIVNALVRDPDSARSQALAQAGAGLLRGDLLDRDSLAQAFAHAGAVYAVTTPFTDGAAGEEQQGANIVDAARAVSLPWLILASVASAGRTQVPHFESKARIEKRLAATDLAWTVIAPSYFYENVLGSREAIANGTLELALPPDQPLQQVSLADLGAFVAAVVVRRDQHIGRRVEVAADAPTPAQMASALGARYVRRDLASVRDRSPDLAAMYEFLSGPGYGIDVERIRADYPEVPWQSFAEWARSEAANPL